MAKRSFQKKPLYRRENRTTHRAPCGHGGEYRWQRNTKAEKTSEAMRQGMGPTHRHGVDYTPLFKFLLSRVGEDWDAVHSEAIGRLDQEAPIHWLVARCDADAKPIVRVGESTYYSGLYVAADNVLRRVEPGIGPEDIFPACPCCTHTFNGLPVPNTYTPERQGQLIRMTQSEA